LDGNGIFMAMTAPVREDRIGMPGIVLERGYLHAARIAGALPLILSPAAAAETRDRLFEHAGGLMLTGGEDVDPATYGEKQDGARRTSPERDAMELQLVRGALERGMPILAICRGIQLLNVALGGTLYQDLRTHRGRGIDHDRYRDFDASIHPVRTDGTQHLKGVFNGSGFLQNSAHHQGIKDLAPGLMAVGWAPDGLVEAVELRRPGAGWTVGVQWHPERRIDDESGTNRRLFARFGEEIRKAAGRDTNS
jgi:putative glutamine amidotransferase